MAKCSKCGVELRSVLPWPKGLVFPHVCVPTKTFQNPATQEVFNALGVGGEWAQESYGEYYARSVPIYSAIKIRAENVVRPPLLVFRTGADGEKTQVEEQHPLQQLLTSVNSWWTRGDLWRATSIYLDLFGSAFWLLKKDAVGSLPTEIWPLRPDRMKILPDKTKYIAGFLYEHNNVRHIYRPDEIIWFRSFNPLDEFAGMSPIAPVRLSADTGLDAVRHNRMIFKNGVLWGNVALVSEAGMTKEQVDEIWAMLKKRYAGTDNSFKPPIFAGGVDAKNLGMSARDMEFVATLRNTISEVSMVYGVPETMLGGMKDTTFANADASERIFWRNTMMSLLMFLQEEINEMLAPQFGEDLSCEFDLSSIEALQEDQDKTATRDREDVKLGILTINEVRTERGLDPVPWGDEPPAPAAPFGGNSNGFGNAPTSADLVAGKDYRLYKKDWSDRALDSIGILHLRILNRNEKAFLIMQKFLFDEQKNDIIKRLNSRKSLTVTKQLANFLFDAEEWMRKFAERGHKNYQESVQQSAEAQINAFKLGMVFNPGTESVKAWLNARIAFWAKRVNEETGKLLMEEIEDGIANGESIPQLQKRVEKVFAFNDAVRSELVARTEMQAATNSGALFAYKQSGVVESKMWLATLDDRVRQHHLDAHRQVVPLEAMFLVGGESLDHPGDGSPANACNCRCTLVPVLSVEKSFNQTKALTDKR